VSFFFFFFFSILPHFQVPSPSSATRLRRKCAGSARPTGQFALRMPSGALYGVHSGAVCGLRTSTSGSAWSRTHCQRDPEAAGPGTERPPPDHRRVVRDGRVLPHGHEEHPGPAGRGVPGRPQRFC
jgi:hypothetical protein